MKTRIAIASALATFAVATFCAHAMATETRQLETIQVTATRHQEYVLDVPNATTIATMEHIRASMPQTAMDALRNKPGMYVQQTTPGQAVVILRGLKGSEILHIVDGFRLNDAIFRNAPNQYVALVDSQSLERIEAVRGPMSGLYGGDAMGGVVQVLTWQPSFDAKQWAARGLIRSTYGSADDSLLTRAEGALGRDGLVLSGGMTYQDVNERRVGGGDELPFTRYSARAGDVKLRASVTEGHEITLYYQYSEQPRTPRYDELTPGYGQEHANSAVYWFAPQRRDFMQMRWLTTNPTALWDSAEVHVGRQELQDDRQTRDYGSINLDDERNRDVTDGVTLQASKSLLGGHRMTWGADVYHDEIDASRLRTNIVTGASAGRAPRFPDGSTMTQVGVFLADDWSFSDDIDMLAALRANDTSTRLPANDAFAATVVDAFGWAGNLGVAYSISEALRAVGNVGRGFRAPNVFDLGTFGDRPGNRFNIPNPELEPETVTSVDAGLKWASPRFTGELIGYYSWYEDKITSVLTGEETATGRLVVQSRNASSLTLYGVEFGATAQLTDTIEIYGTATLTRGDETLEGLEAPADRIPPLNGTAGCRWQAAPAVQIDAFAVFADAQDRYSPRDEVDPRIKPGGTPGWTSWNLLVDWEVSPGFGTAIKLSNASDHLYREFGSGLDAPGIGVSATIEVRF